MPLICSPRYFAGDVDHGAPEIRRMVVAVSTWRSTVHSGTRAFRDRLPSTGGRIPEDLKTESIETIERVSPFSMTGPERLAAVCSATEYVVRNEIPGPSWSAASGEAGA